MQHLEFYNEAELTRIVLRSARILGVEIHEEGARELARRSRGTPRVANRLLRRVRDYAEVRGDGTIGADTARGALDLLEVDAAGFDVMDRRLLEAVVHKFDGGPVGLDNLAAVVGEEPGTLEDVVEPYLIQQGYLMRTPSRKDGDPPRVAASRPPGARRAGDAPLGGPVPSRRTMKRRDNRSGVPQIDGNRSASGSKRQGDFTLAEPVLPMRPARFGWIPANQGNARSSFRLPLIRGNPRKTTTRGKCRGSVKSSWSKRGWALQIGLPAFMSLTPARGDPR